jgi:hypothetical protein
MAGDDSRVPSRREAFMLSLDWTRPSRPLEWVTCAAPVVTQAVAGAGHWAGGRRQRALAAWASAAGGALVAWGRGTEAPSRAEVEAIRRQQRDRLPEPDPEATAAGTRTLTARQHWWWGVAAWTVTGIGLVNGVRSGLRPPRRLTAPAIAIEAPGVAFTVLQTARAVQQRKPRIAAGSALAVAGWAARVAGGTG